MLMLVLVLRASANIPGIYSTWTNVAVTLSLYTIKRIRVYLESWTFRNGKLAAV